MNSRPGVTATEDMAVLPGVLGRPFGRLPATALGTGRTSSPCDVPFRYAPGPIPRYRGTVARWRGHLYGLATAIHEIFGLGVAADDLALQEIRPWFTRPIGVRIYSADT
jgi:hypothetical protein